MQERTEFLEKIEAKKLGLRIEKFFSKNYDTIVNSFEKKHEIIELIEILNPNDIENFFSLLFLNQNKYSYCKNLYQYLISQVLFEEIKKFISTRDNNSFDIVKAINDLFVEDYYPPHYENRFVYLQEKNFSLHDMLELADKRKTDSMKDSVKDSTIRTLCAKSGEALSFCDMAEQKGLNVANIKRMAKKKDWALLSDRGAARLQIILEEQKQEDLRRNEREQEAIKREEQKALKRKEQEDREKKEQQTLKRKKDEQAEGVQFLKAKKPKDDSVKARGSTEAPAPRAKTPVSRAEAPAPRAKTPAPRDKDKAQAPTLFSDKLKSPARVRYVSGKTPVAGKFFRTGPRIRNVGGADFSAFKADLAILIRKVSAENKKDRLDRNTLLTIEKLRAFEPELIKFIHDNKPPTQSIIKGLTELNEKLKILREQDKITSNSKNYSHVGRLISEIHRILQSEISMDVEPKLKPQL